MTSLARGVSVGRYVIIDQIGEGGMGVVYKAYDPELERAVAIKFLRADAAAADAMRGSGERESTGGGRARLLREAKALARLSHPNVLAVFDVGTSGVDVFLATELVEGPTLEAWLRDDASSKTRQAIIKAFLSAGEGLAAAHRAGLVHRDFKPANVMLGADGRVRVLDFGVARMDGTDTTAATAAATATDVVDDDLVGTPRYMAPEQHLGEPVGAKCDQFAFAVCLYEALYGEGPFEGTGAAYVERLVMGEVRAAPAGTHVPRWLRAILVRALSADPQARYPSIEALLADLQNDPAVRRRRILAVALATLALALFSLAAVAWQRERFGVCRGGELRLAGVWDGPRRATLTSVFAKTRVPYADQAARAVVSALDAYTQTWVNERMLACEATRLRGEQSEELLDLRMACFDERLSELRERADLLVTVDAKSVEKAVESVNRLAPLASCSDTAALRAPVRLPSSPHARERYDATRAHVAKVFALLDALRVSDATLEADAALAGARELQYAPALAEALRARAVLEERAGSYEASATSYREAIAAAEAGHHEEIAARAWLELVLVIGERLGHYDEARGLLWIARAKLARLGSPADLPSALLLLEASLDWHKGRYAPAEVTARNAVASLEALYGGHHPDVGRALGLLGIVLEAEGKLDEAEGCHARSLAIMQETFGAEHPRTVTALSHLADAKGARGDHRSAVELYQRILKIDVQSLGGSHPVIAKIYNNMGDELLAAGDVDAAIASFQKALEIWETSIGARHPDVATVLHNLGNAYLAKGDSTAALGIFQRGIALRIETVGQNHMMIVGDTLDLAAAFQAKGDAREANTYQLRAVELDGKLPPSEREYEPQTKERLAAARRALGLASPQASTAVAARTERPQ